MQVAVADADSRPLNPKRAHLTHLIGLTGPQGLMLERVRGMDSKGEGCFAHVETLAKGQCQTDWRVSKKTARRLLRELRELGRIVVAGVRRDTWTIVYLIPGRTYIQERLKLCPKATAALFSTSLLYVQRAKPERQESAAKGWACDAARALLRPGTASESQTGAVAATTIDGVHINAHLHKTYSRALLIEAVRQMKEYDAQQRSKGLTPVLSATRFLTAKCARLAAEKRSDRVERQVRALQDPPQLPDRGPVTPEIAAEAAVFERAAQAGSLKQALLGAPASDAARRAALPNAPNREDETMASSRRLIDLVRDWVRVKKLDTREATQGYYEDRIPPLEQRLGEITAVEWNHDRVVEYIERRQAEKAVKLTTVKRELDMIKGALILERRRQDPTTVLDPAVRLRDPKDYWPRLKVPAPNKDRYLRRHEYEQLREELRQPYKRDWLLWAVYTGGRKGEVAGLRWEDVDLERQQLHIRGTKTEKADRWIPLHPLLNAWVIERTSSRARRGKLLQRWSNVNDDLIEACERAKMDRVNMNDLRRTFCSWMLQAAVPIAVVADLMGHVDTKMVSRVYGHLEAEQGRDAILRL